MGKLSDAQRACLEYYRDNETNPDRRQFPPYTWTTRQVKHALDRGWLCVGPWGWYIPTDAGRAALQQEPSK